MPDPADPLAIIATYVATPTFEDLLASVRSMRTALISTPHAAHLNAIEVGMTNLADSIGAVQPAA